MPRIMITLEVLPEREKEWLNAWTERMRMNTRKKSVGLISAMLFQAQEKPTKYFFITEWESKEAWDKEHDDPDMVAWLEKTGKMLKGPRTREWVELVDWIK